MFEKFYFFRQNFFFTKIQTTWRNNATLLAKYSIKEDYKVT